MADLENLDPDFPELDVFQRLNETLVQCPAFINPGSDTHCRNLIAVPGTRDQLTTSDVRNTLRLQGWKAETLAHSFFGPGIPYDPIIWALCPIHTNQPEDCQYATTPIQ